MREILISSGKIFNDISRRGFKLYVLGIHGYWQKRLKFQNIADNHQLSNFLSVDCHGVNKLCYFKFPPKIGIQSFFKGVSIGLGPYL